MTGYLDREKAMELLLSKHPEKYLLQHGLYTEAIMRVLAKKLGVDEELWGITGLLHDLDYPETKEDPEKHGLMARKWLLGQMPEEALYAICAHNEEYTGVKAQSQFDFALRAAESITGLISAAAFLRPTGMEGMQPKSLKKKMKDKSFAASVDRERIKECEKLGLELTEFLQLAILGMTTVWGEKTVF